MKIPLVLVHGWGIGSKIWQPILSSLSSQFDVTLVDLPGYGEDAEYDGDYSIPVVVERVLGQAPDGKAIWVGWSLGATIVMTAALAQPARFLGLQLISATPRFLNTHEAGSEWFWGTDLEPFEKLAELFEQNHAKAMKRFLLLQADTHDRAAITAAKTWVRELGQLILKSPTPTTHTLFSGLEILAKVDLRTKLGDLSVPTQVVAGTHDQVVPAAASRYLASQLAHEGDRTLEYFEFPTGHLPFIESPAKYLELLTSFANANR